MTCTKMDRQLRLLWTGGVVKIQRLATSTFLGSAGREMIIELLVKPLTSARRNLEGSAVAHERHYVPRTIQDGTAMGAILEVGGHNRANSRIYFIVNIIRDLSPHFFTVDFDGLFRIPALSSKLRQNRVQAHHASSTGHVAGGF